MNIPNDSGSPVAGNKLPWIIAAVALATAAGFAAYALRSQSARQSEPRADARLSTGENHDEDHEKERAGSRDEARGEAHGEAREQGHEDGHPEHETSENILLLKDEALSESGIALDTARERRLAVRLPLQGTIMLNEDRAVHVHPRFAGVILEVRKQLGSRVGRGEVLAVIESNESLQPYSVTSKQAGVVVSRHASVGESVSGEDELFTVADLSTVWVDFRVYRQDFARLRSGQQVRITAEGIPAANVRLDYLSPSSETHSQSLLARAELPNASGHWTPGLFVRGEAAVEEFAALSVRLEAVQQLPGFSDKPVVFVREAQNRYAIRPVRLGRRDGGFVEVTEGLRAGEAYVSRNSFILKAELGKGEAGHDH